MISPFMFEEATNNKEFTTPDRVFQDWNHGKWRIVIAARQFKIPETEKVEVQSTDRFGRTVVSTERVETGRDIRTRFAYIDCYLQGSDNKFRITVYRRGGQWRFSDSTRPKSSQSVKRFQVMATLVGNGVPQDWASAAIDWAEYAYSESTGY